MTKGQQLADGYRTAAMQRFAELSNGGKVPPDYAAQCHACGAAMIDAMLDKPWWHRFVPNRFLK